MKVLTEIVEMSMLFKGLHSSNYGKVLFTKDLLARVPPCEVGNHDTPWEGTRGDFKKK